MMLFFGLPPFLWGTAILFLNLKRRNMMTVWTKPTFEDLRLGLEVTLYISNR